MARSNLSGEIETDRELNSSLLVPAYCHNTADILIISRFTIVTFVFIPEVSGNIVSLLLLFFVYRTHLRLLYYYGTRKINGWILFLTVSSADAKQKPRVVVRKQSYRKFGFIIHLSTAFSHYIDF